MAERTESGTRRGRGDRTRRAVAVVALLAAFGVIATLIGTVVTQLIGDDPAAATGPAAPVTTAAGPPIRPLQIRPVTSSVPVTAETPCPPAGPPPPPTAAQTACDATAVVRYEMAPQAAELQLTAVAVVPSADAGTYAIRISMDSSSVGLLGNYTSSHLDTAMAFVRGRTVVSAPMVSAPIFAETIELSGGLNRQQADQLAALLLAPA